MLLSCHSGHGRVTQWSGRIKTASPEQTAPLSIDVGGVISFVPRLEEPYQHHGGFQHPTRYKANGQPPRPLDPPLVMSYFFGSQSS